MLPEVVLFTPHTERAINSVSRSTNASNPGSGLRLGRTQYQHRIGTVWGSIADVVCMRAQNHLVVATKQVRASREMQRDECNKGQTHSCALAMICAHYLFCKRGERRESAIAAGSPMHP